MTQQQLNNQRQGEPVPVETHWSVSCLYTEAARSLMGGLDLDPASSEQGNNQVGATHFYTQEQHGREQHWQGRVWLNPPVGEQEAWVHSLLKAYHEGHVQQAILLTIAETTSPWFSPLWKFPLCFCTKPVMFFKPYGRRSKSAEGTLFAYLPPQEQSDAVARFTNIFSPFGHIVLPMPVEDEKRTKHSTRTRTRTRTTISTRKDPSPHASL